MRRITMLVTPSVLLLLGCAEGPAGPGPSFPQGFSVQMDSATYTLTYTPGLYDATARVTYTNNTGGPVWFTRCSSRDTVPWYGVARTGPDSTLPNFVGLNDCGGDETSVPPLIIADRATHTFEVSLASGDEPNAQPTIELSWRTGRFHVAFAICTRADRGADQCVAVTSNAFEVRAPQ